MILPFNGALPQTDIGPPQSYSFSSSTEYLRNTLFEDTTPTSRRIFTTSAWLRSTDDDFVRPILSFQEDFDPADDNLDLMFLDSSGTRLYLQTVINGVQYSSVSNTFFYDLNVWHHIVFSVDTTLPLSTSRVKFYFDGTQIPTANQFIPQNTDLPIYSIPGGDGRMYWGTTFDGTKQPCDLAFMQYIDGQALTPSSFTSSGIHVPFSGDPGILGCYLMGNTVGSTTFDIFKGRRWSLIDNVALLSSVPPYLYY